MYSLLIKIWVSYKQPMITASYQGEILTPVPTKHVVLSDVCPSPPVSKLQFPFWGRNFSGQFDSLIKFISLLFCLERFFMKLRGGRDIFFVGKIVGQIYWSNSSTKQWRITEKLPNKKVKNVMVKHNILPRTREEQSRFV